MTKGHRVHSSRLQRILRRHDVEAVTGRCISQIYVDIANGTFPAPVRLGPRAVGWLESEILEWQRQRIAERDAVSKAAGGEAAS